MNDIVYKYSKAVNALKELIILKIQEIVKDNKVAVSILLDSGANIQYVTSNGILTDKHKSVIQFSIINIEVLLLILNELYREMEI